MRCKPNDELRYEWRLSLQQKRGLAHSTVAAKLAALTRFENFSSRRPFSKLSRDQVVAFKEHLLTDASSATGERLSSSTLVHTLEHCGDFFSWLAMTKDGQKLDRDAVSWFCPSRADKERARSTTPKLVPQLDDAISAFAKMPVRTLIDRRNKAVFATLLLTAVRADTLASLTIGSVEFVTAAIRQNANVVRTKFAKSFITFFLPFVPEARPTLYSWVVELESLGLSASDALFPRDPELQRLTSGERLEPGLCPCWSGSQQVRAIVHSAFAKAGFPRHGPHVFRHMLTRHAMSLRPSVEELSALSLNLGHKRLETTLNPYGIPNDERRRDLIAEFGSSSVVGNYPDFLKLLERLGQIRPDLVAEIVSELVRSQIACVGDEMTA